MVQLVHQCLGVRNREVSKTRQRRRGKIAGIDLIGDTNESRLRTRVLNSPQSERSLQEERVDDLMTEVSDGLDRLSEVRQTAFPAELLFIEPNIKERGTGSGNTSPIRSFSYAASAPRTHPRTFVKGRARRRRKISDESYSVGSDEEALAFAREIDVLRAAVLGKDHIFKSPAAEEIVRRILALYVGCTTRIQVEYRNRVRQELDSFSLIVSGENVKRNLEISKRKELYRQVPPEVGPIFGGRIVSGGLPTMGRRRS